MGDNKDIPPGSRSNAPLWMALQLDSCGLIKTDLPQIYCEQQKRNLKADEDSVSLGGMYKYYFISGFKINAMISLNDKESKGLGDFLMELFISSQVSYIFEHINRSL